jgi:hypothetical protein
MKSGLCGVRETYMKINFGIGPNAIRAEPGEIVKFRPVQTSTLGIRLPQGFKLAWVLTVALSRVEVKNE